MVPLHTHTCWSFPSACENHHRTTAEFYTTGRFQKKMLLVSLEIPEPGATAYQNLMRQNSKLTRSDATRSTLRPRCLQSQPKKSKQGSGSLNLPKSPFSRDVTRRTDV